MVVTVGTMLALYLSKTLTLTIVMMGVVGAATAGRTTVGYVFANEFLTPQWQVVFGTLFNLIDGSTNTLIAIYFDFINKHYIYVSCIGFFASVLSVIGTLFLANESPLWQLKMGKIEEA